MTSPEEIPEFRIARLKLGPEDIVVLSYGGVLCDQARRLIEENARACFPHPRKILVLDGGIELFVLQDKEVKATPWSEMVNFQDGLRMLPEHMRPGLRAYVQEGRPTGDFLRCLLSGLLDEAWRRADAMNESMRSTWETVLSDHIPIECHNTPEKYAAWIERGGWKGKSDE